MAAASYELFDPYPVTGAQIRTVAEDSNKSLTDLQGLEGDVKSAHQPTVDAVEGDLEPHVGSAADQPTQQNQSVQQTVTFAKGALIMFANAVDDYNSESGPAYNTTGSKENPRSVSKLNQYYNEKVSNNFGLDYEDYEKGGEKENGDYSADWQAASSALKSELQPEYGWLGGNLDDEADEISGLLKGPITEEKVRQMYGAGGLPSNAPSLWPDFDLSGVSFDELPSDLAAMTDEELAEYLLAHPDYEPNIMLNLDLLAPGVVSIMGSKIAEEIRNADIDWDTDEEKLQHYKDLLQTWQDSSLDVNAAIYESLGAEGSLDFLSKLGTIAYQGTSDDAQDLASVFRRGLGLADAMWDDEQQADFGSDLGQAIEDNRSSYPPKAYESALSYLLEDQYYSTEMLDPLGDKLAEMDRGGRSWCNDGFTLPHDSDLMSSYFSSLAKNGEAALNFFGDDAERHEYYLKEREYLSSPGGMNNLFAALDSATTDETNLSDKDRQHMAAGLVSSIAEYIPDHEQATPDFVHSEGTKHLAHILSTYMEEVSDTILNPVDGANRPGGFTLDDSGFASPIFEQGELKELVKLTISNEDGIVAMREGVSAYQNLELSRDMTDGSLSKSVLLQDARIEGWFMDAVGEQEIQGAEDKDKRIKAWIDMGKNLVGAIPLPGANQIGQLGVSSLTFLSSQGSNMGGEFFTQQFANNEQLEWTKQTQAAESALEARQLMIATQLADPGSYDVEPLISGQDLHDAAAGYPDDQVEKWFGSVDNPTLPSQEEIDAMSQTERDQYEQVLKDVLDSKLPEFENGSYQDAYKLQFQGYFDENFDD